jgi:hypothetical protein
MTIGNNAVTTLMESEAQSERTQVEIGVTLLKKAQDTDKAQAEALLKTLGTPTSCGGCHDGHLDVYA